MYIYIDIPLPVRYTLTVYGVSYRVCVYIYIAIPLPVRYTRYVYEISYREGVRVYRHPSLYDTPCMRMANVTGSGAIVYPISTARNCSAPATKGIPACRWPRNGLGSPSRGSSPAGSLPPFPTMPLELSGAPLASEALPCKIRHLPLNFHCNSGVNSQYRRVITDRSLHIV